MMHADFDLTTRLLGRPHSVEVAAVNGAGGRGSAAHVLFGYPNTAVRCSSSSLMPKPYGMRGGYRAGFARAVLEYTIHAAYTGQGASALTEITDGGEQGIDLPNTSPYAQMIGHVLACLKGDADNQIDPETALLALELTLDVRDRCRNATA